MKNERKQVMNKPLTVAHEDFKQELTNLINRSGLSAFIVEYILQDYLNEVKMISKKQYQLDMSEYKKFLDASLKAKDEKVVSEVIHGQEDKL